MRLKKLIKNLLDKRKSRLQHREHERRLHEVVYALLEAYRRLIITKDKYERAVYQENIVNLEFELKVAEATVRESSLTGKGL